jgi:Flp pilus assembly protein TadD
MRCLPAILICSAVISTSASAQVPAPASPPASTPAPASAPTPASAPSPASQPADTATAQSWVKFGIDNGMKGDLTTAIDNFNQALKVDPNYAPAYQCRGHALSK